MEVGRQARLQGPVHALEGLKGSQGGEAALEATAKSVPPSCLPDIPRGVALQQVLAEIRLHFWSSAQGIEYLIPEKREERLRRQGGAEEHLGCQVVPHCERNGG